MIALTKTDFSWKPPFKWSKLSLGQFLEVVYGYVHDRPAIETAQACGLSSRTVNKLYLRITKRLNGRINIYLTRDFPHHISTDDRWTQRKGWALEHESLHNMESRLLSIGQATGPYWLIYIVLSILYDENFKTDDLQVAAECASMLRIYSR